METKHISLAAPAASAGHSLPVPSRTDTDNEVLESRKRCAEVYSLSPDRIGRPLVLTSTELKDYREPMKEVIALSKGEVQRLFEILADQDYVVTLTNRDGVSLDFRASAHTLDSCDAIGQLPGSIWTEEMQGTNGIGLCIKLRRAVSVVMKDHYASALERVSCTVAPIFGAAGELIATLNVTALRPSDYAIQGVVRSLVAASARRIENLCFDRRNYDSVLLRMSRNGDFCDGAVEARLALDARGVIVDATPSAHLMLRSQAQQLIGQSISAVHGMEEWFAVANQPDTTLATVTGDLYLRLEEGKRTAMTTGSKQYRPHARAAEPEDRPSLETLIGNDPHVRALIEVARRLVTHRVPVLLQGETGTGKSALARAIHLATGGDEGRFVSVNCAAITAELIESELFGYRPGAFTGASRQGSKGRLLEADGGMLFLDEIGDMPLGLQTRLLQVLSDGEFVPVGATRPVTVNFALVAASLHDLAQLVREGTFREDLYFRLAGATVVLPALRERDDKLHLIEKVFTDASKALGKLRPSIDESARRALAAHKWPGNIRELHHATRFAIAVDTDGVIGVNDLPFPLNSEATTSTPLPGGGRRRSIEAALERSNWNVSDAATFLGVSRSTLHRQLKSLGIDRPVD